MSTRKRNNIGKNHVISRIGDMRRQHSLNLNQTQQHVPIKLTNPAPETIRERGEAHVASLSGLQSPDAPQLYQLPGDSLLLLDADNIEGLSNGDEIQQWTNEGSGGDAYSVGGAGPRYRPTGGPENGAYADFESAGLDFLSGSIGSVSQPGIWACVFYSDNTTNPRNLFASTTNNSEWQMQTRTGGVWRVNAGVAGLDSDSSTLVVGTWYWVVCKIDGATSEYEFNTGYTKSGNGGTNNHAGNFLIGKSRIDTNYLDGRIAWLGLWSGTDKQQAVIDYLRNRFSSL